MPETMRRAYRTSLDPSTGLYDGRSIRRRIVEEFCRARRYRYPVSLVIVSFSAAAARQAEERVRQLAEMLEWHTRTADILALWGDETLVLLLPHTGESGARRLGERIYRLATVMQLPAGLGGNPAPVHIGVATLPPDYGGDCSTIVDALQEKVRGTAGGQQTDFAFVSLA